jgi:hypothetical protein
MANSIGTRPIIIDTPASTVLFTSWMKIKNIVFTDYTADTQEFSVQDQNGIPVFEGNGKADLSPVVSWSITWVNGMKVPTLQGGKLIIMVM